MDASRSPPIVASNGQTSAEPAAAFTPGPWAIFSDQGLAYSIMPAGRPGDICNFVGANVPEREANARLIAAAPDLLAALEDALRMVKQYAPNGIERSDRFARSRAAIAKAGGAS